MFYDITVYQKYIDTSGTSGTKHYTPLDPEVRGTITPEGFTGQVRCGQETNVLDLGNGRLIDILTPELLTRKPFSFTGSHDNLNFFDTPYLKLEEDV